MASVRDESGNKTDEFITLINLLDECAVLMDEFHRLVTWTFTYI